MSHYNNSLLLAEKIANTRDTTHAEPEYLRTPDDLRRYLESWNIPFTQPPDASDLSEVLILRDELHSVFGIHDMQFAAQVLNKLLEGILVRPSISLTSDQHMQVELDAEEDLRLARRLGAKAALELSGAIEKYGIDRLHVCEAAPCTEVFVDTSRNHTRRYCCEQCANRYNVAAHRQRQKAE